MNPPSPETCAGAARRAESSPSPVTLAHSLLLRLGTGVFPGKLVPASGRLVLRSWRPLPSVWQETRTNLSRPRGALMAGLIMLAIAFLLALGWELRTSRLQARIFSRRAARLTWQVDLGPSVVALRGPQGPFDLRHGYARLHELQGRLESSGFRVTRQAEPSPELQQLVALGIAPPYQEKNDAGLQILDSRFRAVFDGRRTLTTFRDFVDIPPLVVRSLLFVEDRNLLDDARPRLNPALDWDRLLLSGWRYVLDSVFDTGNTSGGSTLATQVQKFRHSPGGRTSGVSDKMHQMLGASYAAYRVGEDTRQVRRQIVLDYVNGLPLGAAADVGEVTGLGEGLRVWFGKSLEQLVVDLALPEEGPSLVRKAETYKQALALLLATRRPALYLGEDRTALEHRLEIYVAGLEEAGVISAELAGAVRAQPLGLGDRQTERSRIDFANRKAANAIRTDLLELLDVPGYYDLDHLDLRVETTLDMAAQGDVLALLQRLRDPSFLAQNGFYGKHLLGDGDPRQVAYTFSLYRSSAAGNRLLVHTDNLDRPLDLNDMAKLELGSTAKLRTIANYLMVMAQLYDRLRTKPSEELWRTAHRATDPLTRWAAGWLAVHPGWTLERMLDASLERPYSTDTTAHFFTGSGLHSFVNFDNEVPSVVTLRQGFRKSVNLVFIRLMRDLVAYYTAARGYDERAILDNPAHPERRELLEAAVEREAKDQLLAAHTKYGKLDADEAVRQLCGTNGRQLERFAVFFLCAYPEANARALAAEAARLFPERAAEAAAAAPRLVRGYGRRELSLSDQAWLMKRDPFEIWLVRQRQKRRLAPFSELLAQSAEPRRDAYGWLFASRAWRTQNIRLRAELERKAFEWIHGDWRKLGYPFGSLVPSLATAIGSSADRPAALAELVGIVQNDGLRAPTQRITQLHFAAATPYETDFALVPRATERVMPVAVARAMKVLMQDAVENGTAIRAKDSVRGKRGEPIVLGGKTGSGDNRFETFAADGSVLTSRAVSRTASFVFFVGDRHYGVITAHVSGDDANRYSFTSSLALQAFKVLAPSLQPLLEVDDRRVGAGVSTRRAHVAP